MKKNQPLIDEALVNHIANITIVDGWLNKTLIKAKAPSVYMTEYQTLNSNLDDDMKKHLIEDLTAFGVFSNNYSLFFEKRLEIIHKEMVSLIKATPSDDLEF